MTYRMSITQSVSTPIASVNDDQIVSQKQLTTIAENSSVAVQPSTVSDSYPPTLLESFKDITPYELLRKQFKVDEFTITDGDMSFARQWELPFIFKNVPQMKHALASVNFFRADGVEITFVMQHSFTVSGMAIIGHVPGTSVAEMDVYRLSGYPSQLVSIASSSQVIFTCKNYNPDPWIRVVSDIDGTPTLGDDYGYLHWINVAPIRAYGGSADVWNVKVFARLINPKTAAPVKPKSTCPPAPKTKGMKSQSEPTPTKKIQAPFDWEAFDKSSTGSMLSTKASSPIEPIIQTVDSLTPLLSTVLGCLDKPNNMRVCQDVWDNPSREWNLGSGVDNAVRLGLYPRSTKGIKNQFEPMSDLHLTDIASKPMLIHTAALNFGTSDAEVTVFDHVPVPEFTSSMTSELRQPDFLAGCAMMSRYCRVNYNYLVFFCATNLMRCKAQISLLFENSDETAVSIGDTITKVIDIDGDTVTSFSVPHLSLTQYVDPRLREEHRNTYIRIELINAPVGVSTDSFTPTIDVAVFRAAAPGTAFNGLMAPTFTTSEAYKKKKSTFKSQCDFQTFFKKRFEPIVPASFTYESGYIASEQLGSVNDILRRRHIFHGCGLDGFQGNSALLNYLEFMKIPSHGYPSAAQLTHLLGSPFAWLYSASHFWSGDFDLKVTMEVGGSVRASITPNGNIGGGQYRWSVTTQGSDILGSANSLFSVNGYAGSSLNPLNFFSLQIPYYSLRSVEASYYDSPFASLPGDSYHTLALMQELPSGNINLQEYGISAADNFRLYNLRPFPRLVVLASPGKTKTKKTLSPDGSSS
jgi:hypothetical protein